VRRSVLGLVLAVTAAGCTWQADLSTPEAGPVGVEVVPTPEDYDRVTAGPVHALIPSGWRAVATDPGDTVHQGFVASPRPSSWGDPHGGMPGMSATWIDATRVGVPSDYYYLAATGPLLSRLAASNRCRTVDRDVYANNAPSFLTGSLRSSGDYVARAEGVCAGDGEAATRWAYFVAAPGHGPARQVGIPASGLYVVVALAPRGPEASTLLDQLLDHTRFGDAAIDDFVRAVRQIPAD
jgi:hypothetical protein